MADEDDVNAAHDDDGDVEVADGILDVIDMLHVLHRASMLPMAKVLVHALELNRYFECVRVLMHLLQVHRTSLLHPFQHALKFDNLLVMLVMLAAALGGRNMVRENLLANMLLQGNRVVLVRLMAVVGEDDDELDEDAMQALCEFQLDLLELVEYIAA